MVGVQRAMNATGRLSIVLLWSCIGYIRASTPGAKGVICKCESQLETFPAERAPVTSIPKMNTISTSWNLTTIAYAAGAT